MRSLITAQIQVSIWNIPTNSEVGLLFKTNKNTVYILVGTACLNIWAYSINIYKELPLYGDPWYAEYQYSFQQPEDQKLASHFKVNPHKWRLALFSNQFRALFTLVLIFWWGSISWGGCLLSYHYLHHGNNFSDKPCKQIKYYICPWLCRKGWML